MKRSILISILLTMCLMLCACAQNEAPNAEDPVSPGTDNTQQQSPSHTESPTTPEKDTDPTPVFVPEELTVELVVEWEAADALLSRLEDMAEMLRLALEETGYSVERVTITISTAGGFTAESLAQGGIDAAILPTVDFLSNRTGSIAAIAMSTEEISETVIALSLAKGQPDSAFSSALFDALTSTEKGHTFLTLCRPGTSFVPPTEEAMQAVLDWMAQQEENGDLAA